MPAGGIDDDEINERLTKTLSGWLFTFGEILALLGVVHWQECPTVTLGFSRRLVVPRALEDPSGPINQNVFLLRFDGGDGEIRWADGHHDCQGDESSVGDSSDDGGD
jgi:hypothetical protein